MGSGVLCKINVTQHSPLLHQETQLKIVLTAVQGFLGCIHPRECIIYTTMSTLQKTLSFTQLYLPTLHTCHPTAQTNHNAILLQSVLILNSRFACRDPCRVPPPSLGKHNYNWNCTLLIPSDSPYWNPKSMHSTFELEGLAKTMPCQLEPFFRSLASHCLASHRQDFFYICPYTSPAWHMSVNCSQPNIAHKCVSIYIFQLYWKSPSRKDQRGV